MAKKFSKKMDPEERKEFKGGKYMGGRAEEMAEKKNGKKHFGKRMAVGGPVGYGGTQGNDPVGRGGSGGTGLGGVAGGVNGGDRGRGGPAGGVTTGNVTGTSARNAPPGMARRAKTPAGPKPITPKAVAPKPIQPKIATPLPPADMPAPEPEMTDDMLPAPPSSQAPIQNIRTPGLIGGREVFGTPGTGAVGYTGKRMRGGGLAKKGVGMALAKGGLAKGYGCAQRGIKKTRMK